MPIESFLFFFKGNQETANEQLVKIEGICCMFKEVEPNFWDEGVT